MSVISKRQVPTIEDAKTIVRLLVKSFPEIDAILLCGSVARGDADEWSDIDLVIIGSDPELTPSDLRKALSGQDERVSLIYYPTPVFQKLYQERALFIAHLKKEGLPLYDRLNLLTGVLSRPFTPIVNVTEEIMAYRAKLAPYTDPRRFNNNFLFCLSHLYSIGKGVIMLGLAKEGVLEFNRESAFRRFTTLNPDLRKEIQDVAQLRPFYRLVTERQPEPLPFSYQAADRQMQETVRSIEILAERVGSS